MTWANRVRLLGGLVISLAVIFVLVVVFNQRQHTIASTSATIIAPRAAVASNYGGTVVTSYVQVGQPVQVGDPLFRVNSIALQQDLARGVTIASSEGLRVEPETGTLLYLATTPGTMTEVNAQEGSYLTASEPLAIITGDTDRIVQAQFVLTPIQYGLIERGAAVTLRLPNDSSVNGRVASALVTTVNTAAVVTVRVTSDELNSGDLNLVATDGAPVQAVVQLRDEGLLAGPSDALRALIHKIGL